MLPHREHLREILQAKEWDLLVEVLWAQKMEYQTSQRSQVGGPGALLAEGSIRAVERLIHMADELHELDQAVREQKESEDEARKSAGDDGY